MGYGENNANNDGCIYHTLLFGKFKVHFEFSKEEKSSVVGEMSSYANRRITYHAL